VCFSLFFLFQVVNTIRGNEEYVHLKSLEDEFHYVESNMPPGHGGKPDLDDKEGQPRVESPRRPSGNPGEGVYYDEEGEEGKYGGMTEEEYEEARKKHQQQFYGNPANNNNNEQPFSDDMHSVVEEGKQNHRDGETADAAHKNEENPYDFFDHDNPEEEGKHSSSSQPPTDPFLLTSKFTSAALSPDQTNLSSKYMKQQNGFSRSRNFETEGEGDLRSHSPSGNESKAGNNDDDYDQHVFLHEPVSSLPNSNNSTMNSNHHPYSDPSTFDSNRKESTESPLAPPLTTSVSDPIIPLSSSVKSLSNTTAFSQRSSYESLHEID
jgi:hypothetical protein